MTRTDSALRLSFQIFADKGPLRPQFARRTADRHWREIAPHLTAENRELIERAREWAMERQDRSTFDEVVSLVRMEHGW